MDIRKIDIYPTIIIVDNNQYISYFWQGAEVAIINPDVKKTNNINGVQYEQPLFRTT